MTTTKTYFVICNTESPSRTYQVEVDEGDTPVCPTDSAHSVTTMLLGSTNVKQVSSKIIEEVTPTGYTATSGKYRIDTKKIIATANTTTTAVYSYPIPISVLAIEYVTKDTHEGDHLCGYAIKDLTVGVLTRDESNGATDFQVSSTALAAFLPGYHAKLVEGAITNDLGKVISKNTVSSEITIETACTNSFSDAGNALVQMSIIMLDMEIGAAWEYTVGEEKIGGSYVPANTPITVQYTNNSPSTQKDFLFSLRYLY